MNMTVTKNGGLKILAVSALLWLCGCATEPALPQGNGVYSVETGHEYKLGPGDKVRVTVFGENALSGEFLIANNGQVSLPLVGPVKAGGITLTGFENAIQDQLTASGMVRSPKVSADIVEYRPYYILGEVNKPQTPPSLVRRHHGLFGGMSHQKALHFLPTPNAG